MLKSFIESCQELVFPSCCLECKEHLPFRDLPLLCSKCYSSISYISSPKCICCGTSFQAGMDHLCGLCHGNSYAFDIARAAMHYQKPATSLISDLKFNGNLAGVSTLAHLAKNSPNMKNLSEPDIIIPVPLHINRLRERLFNQAVVIAQSCFREKKQIIAPDILIRRKATPPQTGLSGAERRKNLAGAFTVKKAQRVKNKNILLVDDVFTTGSTVNECAKVLRRAGAKRIEVFTLARAM